MKITYDARVDALYIRFLDAAVVTQNVSDGVAFDYDADGNLAGIEVLEAAVRIGKRDPLVTAELEQLDPGALLAPAAQQPDWQDEED